MEHYLTHLIFYFEDFEVLEIYVTSCEVKKYYSVGDAKRVHVGTSPHRLYNTVNMCFELRRSLIAVSAASEMNF